MLICFMLALWQDSGTVFNNGHFYLGSGNWAKCLIERSGEIVFIGEDQADYPQAKDWPVVDLDGKWVLPGLIDAHAHLTNLGTKLENLDLVGTTSFEQIIEQVKKEAENRPKGSWIIGRGWDQNDWPDTAFPHHEKLSEAVPDHPVFLTRIDGHALLVNAKAMAISGLNADSKAPAGGKILQVDGQPSGVLIDKAMGLIKLPKADSAQIQKRIELASQDMLSQGLTGIHDAGVSSDELRVMEKMAKKGELPVRVYAMLAHNAQTLSTELPKGPQINRFDGFLSVRSIKCYMDGALGSRGAWLKKPYSDEPSHSGLQLTSDQDFKIVLDMAKKSKFQVNTHAIGDQANAFVLNSYAQLFSSKEQSKAARFRVEHAQILDPEDFNLFKENGILPSMQPTHCTSDMPWAPKRLGHDRIRGAYAWRDLIDLGLIIPMGSDFPVEHVSPWLGLYAAITTQDLEGKPPKGFRPSQKLTREEALKGFTEWAAYGAFQEDMLGKLAVGFRADFIVIDRNYFEIPEKEIPNTVVLRTIVNGETRFQFDN